MQTQTAERVDAEIAAKPAVSKGEVAPFLQPPRLPYHPAVEERFGIDKAGWNALVGAIWPNAKTTEAIAMALSYCRARDLDPFKRPVHIVPMWSSAAGKEIETVWPGISEIRTTAFRTGNYAGCDQAEFGPDITETFKGRAKIKGEWGDHETSVSFPEWCRITVYRELKGRICKFVGPKVKWLEAYASIGNSALPNDMWQSRPEGQLEKCAEAAALRKAFPEEIGNQLTAEEMHGRVLLEPQADLTLDPPEPPKAEATPIEKAIAQAEGAKAEMGRLSEQSQKAEMIAEKSEPAKASSDTPPTPPKTDMTPDPVTGIPKGIDRTKDKPKSSRAKAADKLVEIADWLEQCEAAANSAETVGELTTQQDRVMTAYRDMVSPADWEKGCAFFAERASHFLGDPEPEPEPEQPAFDGVQWLRDLDGACGAASTIEALSSIVKEKTLMPAKGLVTPEQWSAACILYKARLKALVGDADLIMAG